MFRSSKIRKNLRSKCSRRGRYAKRLFCEQLEDRRLLAGVAGGYDYEVLGIDVPNAFATVELPVLGFGDEIYELIYEHPTLGTATTTLDAGIEFDFELDGGVIGGVDSFRVLGIEIPPGLDPTDPLAFPTFLSFVAGGDIELTLTPLVTPEAVDDDYSVDQGDTLAVLAPGVLFNDSDVNGDSLTASPVTGPSNGELTFSSDGSFTYRPDPGFHGTDSFTYNAFDGLFDSTTPATVTITVNPIPLIYISPTSSGLVDGITFRNEDIMVFDTDTGSWSMHFDGSDVGLSTADIDALHVEPDTSILLSLRAPKTISGLGRVDDSDIIQFTPTTLGDNTSGTFSMFLDGSNVGLTTSQEDIDAISRVADGRLVISTLGSFSVPATSGGNLTGRGEDLIVLNGSLTNGDWDLLLDGSTEGLTRSSERVNGASIRDNGDIDLVTRGRFSVPGLSGDANDIFTCEGGGPCTFSQFFEGDAEGLRFKRIDGISIFNPAPAVNRPPVANTDIFNVDEDGVLNFGVSTGITRLQLDSEPGDFVGQGQTLDFDPGDGTFTASHNVENAVSVNFAGGPGNSWFLRFSAPFDVELTPGTFLDATRYPFQDLDVPGLSVSGQGRGCNMLMGEFTVHDIEYGAGSTINRFDASFEQHCEGLPPALTGRIQFNDHVLTGESILDNDSDPDGDSLTLIRVNGSPANIDTQISLPSGALLTVNANGSFSYDPNGQFDALDFGQTDADGFTYEIGDGNGGFDTGNVEITIHGFSAPPILPEGLTDTATIEPLPLPGSAAELPGGNLTLVYPELVAIDSDVADRGRHSGSSSSTTQLRDLNEEDYSSLVDQVFAELDTILSS